MQDEGKLPIEDVDVILICKGMNLLSAIGSELTWDTCGILEIIVLRVTSSHLSQPSRRRE